MNEELDKELQEDWNEKRGEDDPGDGEEVLLEEEVDESEDVTETIQTEEGEEEAEKKDFLREDPVELDEGEKGEVEETPDSERKTDGSIDPGDEAGSQADGHKSRRKRWVIVTVAGVVLVSLLVVGARLSKDLISHAPKEKIDGKDILPPPPALEIKAVKRTLEPFFIPMTKENTIARVSIAVKWDSISDKRFNEKRTKVRTEIFNFLKQYSNSKKDLQKQKGVLEEGLGIVFANSMGISGTRVVLKEIEFI